MAKDDDLLPKKKPSTSSSRGGAALRLLRGVRIAGLLAGGLVTLTFFMSVVGLVTDNLWARLIVALVFVIGLPAFVSERVLRRVGGGAARVGDVFAIVWLGVALVLVSLELVSRPLLSREGDRYARSGSRVAARVVYFLAGVSPVFPEERAAAPDAPAPAAGADAGGAK